MHKTDKDLENLLRAENVPNRVKDIECKMQEDSFLNSKHQKQTDKTTQLQVYGIFHEEEREV